MLIIFKWYGLGNGPRLKTESHYGCLKVNTKAIPLQATVN